jgi:hypothetical protein
MLIVRRSHLEATPNHGGNEQKTLIMKALYLVIIVILLFFSCNRGQQIPKSNKIKLLIPELQIADSISLRQLENIIFTSSCFSLHRQSRQVFRIFKSRIFEEQNLFGISFNSYCGYTEKDLKDDCGGFFVRRDNLLYLFVVKNIENFTPDIYKKTNNMIDVTPYMGIIEESDAIWYVKYVNGNLKIIYLDCP